jgi:hypothetical protein
VDSVGGLRRLWMDGVGPGRSWPGEQEMRERERERERVEFLLQRAGLAERGGVVQLTFFVACLTNTPQI